MRAALSRRAWFYGWLSDRRVITKYGPLAGHGRWCVRGSGRYGRDGMGLAHDRGVGRGFGS